jgi:hypothetical protein
MPAVEITVDDLEPFATIEESKAEAMISDAVAMATLIAPCITDEEFAHADAAKAVIRGAILRWHDSGTGAMSAQVAGPFQQTFDTRQPRRSLFWPTEIESLQKMCQDSTEGGAWSYDTAPCPEVEHADICTLNLGGNYCSCGAILTMYAPLWENR